MADQILSVDFRINTGNIEGDAAAAGKLAAKAFEQGFGALDLKTPMAKAGEAAQKQAAAIGESLHAATVSHAAPGGEARPSSEAAEASKKRREELHEEAEGIQRAAAGARMLHAGLELVGGSLSGAGLAVGARAFGEFAKSSIEAGGGAGKLAETAEKLAPVITTVVGALAAGAVISHEFAEKGAEAREELDAMSKSSGIGTESLVKFGSLMRGRGVDISEFGRSVALLQTRLQQGRGEIEKLSSEEPRQTADAQLAVRDAYRKREEATVSLADAEEKVVGGKARSAVTLAGAAIRDQIAKEKGPMDVVASLLGLGEAQEGQRHDAAVAPLNIASAVQRLRLAQLGPEREELQFAEAKEGVQGARVNLGSALIQARGADIRSREAHGETVSREEKRQLSIDAADQSSVAAWEHVREAGLGIREAKLHQEEVATGEGGAQIGIGKALEDLVSTMKVTALQSRADSLKVQQAGLGVRGAEATEAERQAAFKVTGSNIVGALSPAAQIEHDKNVEKLDAIGLARAADQPAAADRDIGRAEDTLKFQGLGQVTQLAGRILTGQGPDITKASPEILLPALQQAAKQAYGEDSGLLGVFKALAKFIQREPESAAIAPMMQRVFPRIAALPHGDVELNKVRSAFGDPSLDIEGTINRPTDENEKLRASPEQLEKAEGMAIARQRLNEAQKDVQGLTLQKAGPGFTKATNAAANVVEAGGPTAAQNFGEIANGLANTTAALALFTKTLGGATKAMGGEGGEAKEDDVLTPLGIAGGAYALKRFLNRGKGGAATPEEPAEAAPAEALPEAVKAPIELPRFLGAGAGPVEAAPKVAPVPEAAPAPAAPGGGVPPVEPIGGGAPSVLGSGAGALGAGVIGAVVTMAEEYAFSRIYANRIAGDAQAGRTGLVTDEQNFQSKGVLGGALANLFGGGGPKPRTETQAGGERPAEGDHRVAEAHPAEPPRPAPIEAGKDAGAAGALMGAAGALTGAAGALQGAAGALTGAAGAKGGTPVENATEKAAGGLISGPGSGTSDSIPAWLSHGEYVVKADRVQQLGVPFLDQLNAGKFEFGGLVRGFAEGGEVTPSAFDPGPGWLERARAVNLAAQAKAKGDADKAKADAEKERSAPQYGAYGSLEEANKDVGDAKAWEGYRIPVAGENATPPPDPAKPRSKLSDVKEMADVSVDYGGGNKKTFNVHKSHGLQGMPQHPGEGEGWKWEGGLLVDPQGNYSNPDGGDKPSQKRHAASSPGLETPFESLPEVHDDGEKPIRFPGVLAHHAHHHAHPQRAAGASDDDMWNPDRKLSFGGLVRGYADGGIVDSDPSGADAYAMARRPVIPPAQPQIGEAGAAPLDDFAPAPVSAAAPQPAFPGLAGLAGDRSRSMAIRLPAAIGSSLADQGLGAVKSAWSAVTLPGDVATGKADASSQEAVNRSINLAGLLTSPAAEAGAVANPNALGVFAGAKQSVERAKWFHGTQQAWDATRTDPVYLTKHADEAVSFARNPMTTGNRAVKGAFPQFHKFEIAKGSVENIDEQVMEALEDGNVDEAIGKIAQARIAAKSPTRYLEFEHPSVSGKRDSLTARVALYPHEDLRKIGTWIDQKPLSAAPDEQPTAPPGFASGGLARVSNGEYRINAGAVTKYGARLMAMLNSSGQFSSGGLVGDADTSNPGRFDDWGNGMSRGLSASLPPGISSQDHGTHSEHTLDLVTSAGQFRMQASADTIEAIRASAIGQKLTSTGVKPGWY